MLPAFLKGSHIFIRAPLSGEENWLFENNGA